MIIIIHKLVMINIFVFSKNIRLFSKERMLYFFSCSITQAFLLNMKVKCMYENGGVVHDITIQHKSLEN